MKKIGVIGIACVDIYAKGIKKMPMPGELNHLDMVELYTGGCALNTAINISKMGFKSDLYIPVGKDYLGRFILNELDKYQIEKDNVHIDETIKTSSSIVLINEDGERAFLHAPGTNASYKISDINLSNLDGLDILFISGALALKSLDGEPLSRVLQYAKSKGIYTIVDTVWDPTNQWLSLLEDVLKYTDMFAPSFDEAKMISNLDDYKEMVDFFKSLGVKDVLIKLGSKGAYVDYINEKIFVESVYTNNVVDTTGAGDSFMSGLICAMANDYPIKKALQFANTVGNNCIQSIGASTGIKTFIELEKERDNYYENK